MIFDAHMHPFPLFFARHEMGAPGFDLHTPELVEETLQANGISGALMLSPNGEHLIEIGRRVPNVYGMIWTSPRSPTMVQDVAAWLEHPEIVGIKLHPLADGFDPSMPALDPLYELAAARDVAIVFHSGHEFGSVPWLIEKAARRHPSARFVMAHMGLHALVYVEAAIEAGERTPNLYFDTAAMPFIFKLRDAVKRLGVERIMYGSDAPFFDPRIEIEKIRLAGFSDDQLERLFWRNALDIYFTDANRPTLG